MELAWRLPGLKSLALERASAVAAGALLSLARRPLRLPAHRQRAGAPSHLLTPDPLIRQYPAMATLW